MFAYALTIFTSAFLLFQVQPLIGKYILPWFGGSPGVWTTCMLFFQTVLLAGYAYAHWSGKKLKPSQQAIVHTILLVAALVLLPITPADHWKPREIGTPIFQILFLLTANLGLPFLVLSATGPLIQKWYSQSHPGVSPYRLYALSNLGSLLALLSYPFYFEWSFTRSAQGSLWSWGFGFFAIICFVCALKMRKAAKSAPQEIESLENVPAPSGGRRLLWLVLPALASVLLLATTNKLCQDLAVIPFLWVLPLSIYLLTFIICFDSPRWYGRGFFSLLTVVGFCIIADLLSGDRDVSVLVQIIGYGVALFAACMMCHGELYRLKPHPKHLTSFYLMIAAGGAIGGFLVAVAAPLIFSTFLELPLGYFALSVVIATLCLKTKDRSFAIGAAAGVLAAIVIVPILLGPRIPTAARAAGIIRSDIVGWVRDYWKEIAVVLVGAAVALVDFKRVIIREWQFRAISFPILIALVLGSVFAMQIKEDSESAISRSRGFFGVLTVYDYNPDEPQQHYYLLEHGKITHGIQFTDPIKARWHTTYYGPTSGIGRAFDVLPTKAGQRRIGLVGLGTGSLASYATPGDSLRVYEINDQVRSLATTRFRYLANCGADVQVVLGDARLSMENELDRGDPQKFDILALDAFNSDAIPVHLLTEEAFATYLKQIKPDGVIAVHISNLYFDLQPVVERMAKRYDLDCVTISDDDNPDWWLYDTTWMLVSPNHDLFKAKVVDHVAERPKPANVAKAPLWTDDYTSLYKILRR